MELHFQETRGSVIWIFFNVDELISMDQDWETVFCVQKLREHFLFPCEGSTSGLTLFDQDGARTGKLWQVDWEWALNIFQCESVPKIRMETRVEEQYICGMPWQYLKHTLSGRDDRWEWMIEFKAEKPVSRWVN